MSLPTSGGLGRWTTLRITIGLAIWRLKALLGLALLAASCQATWPTSKCALGETAVGNAWTCQCSTLRVVLTGTTPGGLLSLDCDGTALPFTVRAKEIGR